jgi:hypothetical protein
MATKARGVRVRRLVHEGESEGHTICKKYVLFYSRCVLVHKLNAENYGCQIDGHDDGADDQHDKGYLGEGSS